MFSGDSGPFFSLHSASDYFGEQFGAEFFEEDLLVNAYVFSSDTDASNFYANQDPILTRIVGGDSTFFQ